MTREIPCGKARRTPGLFRGGGGRSEAVGFEGSLFAGRAARRSVPARGEHALSVKWRAPGMVSHSEANVDGGATGRPTVGQNGCGISEAAAFGVVGEGRACRVREERNGHNRRKCDRDGARTPLGGLGTGEGWSSSRKAAAVWEGNSGGMASSRAIRFSARQDVAPPRYLGFKRFCQGLAKTGDFCQCLAKRFFAAKRGGEEKRGEENSLQ